MIDRLTQYEPAGPLRSPGSGLLSVPRVQTEKKAEISWNPDFISIQVKDPPDLSCMWLVWIHMATLNYTSL